MTRADDLAHHRIELGEPFQRGVRPVAVVHGDGDVFL